MDKIFRQDALDACDALLPIHAREMRKRINEIPAAGEGERITAENLNSMFMSCDQFICSECGIHLQDWVWVDDDDYRDGIVHQYEFKYCPNCGAKILE